MSPEPSPPPESPPPPKEEQSPRPGREENTAFLLTLGDRVRPLTDSGEILAVTSRMLGEHLGVDRVVYTDIDAPADRAVCHRDWTRGQLPSAVGAYTLSSFGPAVVADLKADRVVVIHDVRADPRTRDNWSVYNTLDFRSFIVVPLVKGDDFVNSLTVHSRAPRRWRMAEIELVGEVAERTWEAIERARVEEALRAREAQHRSLFNSMDEGFCVIEMIFDEEGEPVDYLFLETNPMFESQTGLEDAVGRTARELVPNLEKHWFEIYGGVATSGEPTRFVNGSEAMGRWFNVYAFPTGEEGSGQVAILFADITERKRAEDALRRMNEELETRVAERTAQVRRLVTELTLSEQAERRRISAILHDDLQQRLFGLQYQHKSLSNALETGEVEAARGMLDAIRQALDLSVQITRRLSVDLSPPILHNEGLAEALGWLASQMERQHGLVVAVQTQANLPRLPEDQRVLVFQIVRELLFNIVKHAGVSRATIALSRGDGALQVVVSDQGEGFDLELVTSDLIHSHGLDQSRKRLDLVGGRMEIESSPGQGTRVTLICPLGSLAGSR